MAEYAIRTDGPVELTQYNPLFQANDELRQAISSGVDSQLAQTYSNLLQQTFVKRKRDAVDAFAQFSRRHRARAPGRRDLPRPPTWASASP